MSNVLMIIEEREILGKTFRIYGTIEEPLFLAKDVAEWIDYSTDKVGQMINTVDETEKSTSPIYYSGQVREMWFLTEDGLYEVLMQSNKQIAKEFKKQVKVILKEIRKNGMYLTEQTATNLINDEEAFLARAYEIAQNKIAKFEARIAQQNKEITQIVQHNTVLVKKEIAYNAVCNANNLYKIGNVAKLFGIGTIKFFEILRHLNELNKDNTPNSQNIANGYMEVKEKFEYKQGKFSTPTPLFTSKGIDRIARMLYKHKYINNIPQKVDLDTFKKDEAEKE